MTDKAALLI